MFDNGYIKWSKKWKKKFITENCLTIGKCLIVLVRFMNIKYYNMKKEKEEKKGKYSNKNHKQIKKKITNESERNGKQNKCWHKS